MTGSPAERGLGRRLRLALPFTILSEPDTVRLVAGEDHRYTLRAPGLEGWLPGVLDALDGSRPLDAVLASLPPPRRAEAEDLALRLLGERVLVDAPPPSERQTDEPLAVAVEGQGPLVDRVRARVPRADRDPSEDRLRVLCQDALDYEAALAFHAACLARGEPALWVTTGPLARAFLSPLLLPRDGACLACLLARFHALSPAPELMDALRAHARAGGEIRPVPFPARGVDLLAELVAWKLELAAAEVPPPALYELHVLDAGALTVSSHAVWREPDCEVCAPWR